MSMLNSRLKRHPMAAAILLALSAPVFADCVGSTCTGATTLDGMTQTGATVLDASSGAATLNLVNGALLQNDSAAAGKGTTATMTLQGANSFTVNNNSASNDDTRLGIVLDRGSVSFDTAGWGNDAAGHLTNGGVPVGVAAGIHAPSGTGALVYDSSGGSLSAKGDYSAAAFGNAAIQSYRLQFDAARNRGASLGAVGYTAGDDTLKLGHWVIANYGAGLTTIVAGGNTNIGGDILMLDSSPLHLAALAYNPALKLDNTAEAGVRDSAITLGGDVTGNFYFGSGTHVLDALDESDGYHGARLTGNIYVDQRDIALMSVAGGVASTVGSVGGARRFTFDAEGSKWNGDLSITDTAAAVNVVNMYDGDATFRRTIAAVNGIGSNTLNWYCRSNCQYQSEVSGFTTLNLVGLAGGQRTVTLNKNGSGISLSGDFNVENALLELHAPVTAANFNLAADAILNVTDPAAVIHARLNARGGIRLGINTLTADGLDVASGAVIATTINSAGNGRIVVAGATGTVSDGAVIAPTVSATRIHDGDTVTVVENATGTPRVANSGLVKWTASNTGTGIVLTADTDAAVSLPGLTAGAVRALNTLHEYHGTNSDLNALATRLQGYTTAEIMHAAERLRPEINDGSIRTVLGMTDRVLGLVESRLFESHLGKTYGILQTFQEDAASTHPGLWMQGFGLGGTQKTRDGVDGYSSAATGLAGGADRLLGGERLRVGVALGYGYGQVNNLGVTDNNNLLVNSYLGALYASWAGDDWYANGALGLGRQAYVNTRVPFQAESMRTTGHHRGEQFTAKIDAGVPLRFSDELVVVPVGSLSYNRVTETGYEETGTGSLVALGVEGKQFESLRSGLGARALYSIQEDDWRADLEMRSTWSHEFGDLAQDVVAHFLAGAGSFTSPAVPTDRNRYLLGGGLRLSGANDSDEISVLLNYDSEFGEHAFSQVVSMQLRYDFEQAALARRQAEYRMDLAKSQASAPVSAAATDADVDVDRIRRAIAPGKDTAACETAVAGALSAWAAARATGDAERYLDAYAADYADDGGGHRQWMRRAKAELEGSGKVAVNIAYLKVQVGGSEASAVFTQTLGAAGDVTVSRKIVDLVQSGSRWKIVGETSLPVE